VNRRRVAEAAAVVLATTHNWSCNRRVPRSAYVPANLAYAAVLVGLARWSGISWAELGLDRSSLGEGVRTGAVVGSAVVAAVAGLAAHPRTRPLFHDERVLAHNPRSAAVEACYRIPVGTALAEELAFRSALLSLSGSRRSWGRSVAWTSSLFGLWHILPAVDRGPLVDAADSALPGGYGPAVTGTVAATGIAGAVLAVLRRRSGSVVAPVMVHAAANVAGFVAARWIDRRDRRAAPPETGATPLSPEAADEILDLTEDGLGVVVGRPDADHAELTVVLHGAEQVQGGAAR